MLRRWRQLDQRPGIYVIGCGPKFIKIGWSNSIGTRLRQLEEVTPEYLGLYRVFDHRTSQDERRLHRHFKDVRHKGEWFLNAGNLIEFIGDKRLTAGDLPDTYNAVTELLSHINQTLPPFPEEPIFIGPPTMYQRYLELVDAGGGTLLVT